MIVVAGLIKVPSSLLEVDFFKNDTGFLTWPPLNLLCEGKPITVFSAPFGRLRFLNTGGSLRLPTSIYACMYMYYY